MTGSLLIRMMYIFIAGFILLYLPTTGWGLSITSPNDGIEVHPGDSILVAAAPGPGEQVESVQFAALKQVFIDKIPPFEYTVIVPMEAIGPMGIGVLALNKQTGNFVTGKVTVHVVLPANVTLQKISVNSDRVVLFSPGDSKQLYVSGLYSDGVERKIVASDSGTIYQTLDSRIATVDAEGLITAVAPGKTIITVKNGVKQLQVQVNVTAE